MCETHDRSSSASNETSLYLAAVSRSRNGSRASHSLPLCDDVPAFSISSTSKIGLAMRVRLTARAAAEGVVLLQPFVQPPNILSGGPDPSHLYAHLLSHSP